MQQCDRRVLGGEPREEGGGRGGAAVVDHDQAKTPAGGAHERPQAAAQVLEGVVNAHHHVHAGRPWLLVLLRTGEQPEAIRRCGKRQRVALLRRGARGLEQRQVGLQEGQPRAVLELALPRGQSRGPREDLCKGAREFVALCPHRVQFIPQDGARGPVRPDRGAFGGEFQQAPCERLPFGVGDLGVGPRSRKGRLQASVLRGGALEFPLELLDCTSRRTHRAIHPSGVTPSGQARITQR